MKKLLLVSLIISIIFTLHVFANEDNTDTKFGAIRYEGEYKLNIPIEIQGDVLNYLNERYKDPSWLTSTVPSLTSSLESDKLEEEFVDTYFDNNNLDLYSLWDGVRHRKRYDKNQLIKEWIQVKVTPGGTNDTNLMREEFKYRPRNPNKFNDPLDWNNFLKYVNKKDRAEVIKKISNLSINPLDLRPIIDVKEKRKRIYLRDSKENILVTITFDETSSTKLWTTIKYNELELEMNEIIFTDGTELQRKELQAMDLKIYEDLIKKFPSIKMDQKPKYTKSLDYLTEKNPLIKPLIQLNII